MRTFYSLSLVENFANTKDCPSAVYCWTSSVVSLIVSLLLCVQYTNGHGHCPSSQACSCRAAVSYVTGAFEAIFSPKKGKGARSKTSQFSGLFLASELGCIKQNWCAQLLEVMLLRFRSPCMATNFLILYNRVMTVLGHRRTGRAHSFKHDFMTSRVGTVVIQCEYHCNLDTAMAYHFGKEFWVGGHPFDDVGHFTWSKPRPWPWLAACSAHLS